MVPSSKFKAAFKFSSGSNFGFPEAFKYPSRAADLADINARILRCAQRSPSTLIRIILNIVRSDNAYRWADRENSLYFRALLRRLFKQDEVPSILKPNCI